MFGDLRAYVDDRYVDTAKRTEYAFNRFGARRSDTDDSALFEPRSEAAFQSDRKAEQEKHSAPAPSMAMPQATPRYAKPMASFKAADDLETVLRGKESTFTEHLLDLLNECGEKDSDVYRRAEISRQLFHKIVGKKDYQPTKSTAIQLALGLRLDLPETQKLLEKAGYALSRSSKTDLVVQYFIERRIYSIVTINTALYDCGLPLLKTGSVS